MTYVSSLAAAHAIVVTLGFVGLIATNFWLLVLARHSNEAGFADALRGWRNATRIFGPLTGVGILLGFWLASASHVPLGSRWLLIVYAIMVVTLATQATIVVPWQLHAASLPAAATPLPTKGLTVAIGVFTLAYVCIMLLMLARPV